MLKSKIASVVATGALLLSAASPAFAADSLEITGNGALSVNNVNDNSTNVTAVQQSNTAVVTNNVSSNANSGNNTADFNTGGQTTVVAGPAKSSTEVVTAVNANNADVTPCNCVPGAGDDVKISGNGATSFNNANLNKTNTTVLGQTNQAAVTNNVASNANSGDNHAAFNTGGAVVVQSGLAQADTDVTTLANVNVASMGGHAGAGAGLGNGASALITGNGAGSLNNINLNLLSSVTLAQQNSAAISNNVSSNANSGGNSGDFNTGGAVTVVAGPALASTDVDTLANFNSADLDCGCLTSGVDAKIGANGAIGFNNINANLASVLGIGQGNGAAIGNNNGSNANSGVNAAGFNTSAPSNDPAVVSLGSQSTTSVSTMANWNDAGTGATLSLPGGGNLNLLMDFSSLLTWLHMM